MPAITLRPARPPEARQLSELAYRSAASRTGEPPELLRGQPWLTLLPDQVPARRVTVAERYGLVVGFNTLEGEPPYAEVGMFYVEPAAMGTGVGRRMWADLVDRARTIGIDEVALGAEPLAEGFYLKMGMKHERTIVHEGSPMVWMTYSLA